MLLSSGQVTLFHQDIYNSVLLHWPQEQPQICTSCQLIDLSRVASKQFSSDIALLFLIVQHTRNSGLSVFISDRKLASLNALGESLQSHLHLA